MEIAVLFSLGIVPRRANATQCVFRLSGILDKFYFPQNILPKKIVSGKEIQTQAGLGNHSLGFR